MGASACVCDGAFVDNILTAKIERNQRLKREEPPNKSGPFSARLTSGLRSSAYFSPSFQMEMKVGSTRFGINAAPDCGYARISFPAGRARTGRSRPTATHTAELGGFSRKRGCFSTLST